MITMDKKYRTRDGRAVRVLCVDRKSPLWPVVALVEAHDAFDEEERIYTYTSKGYTAAGNMRKGTRDLIEIKTKKVLKSIKQLMEEYPDWYFNQCGSFVFGFGGYAIASHKLPLFDGKCYEDGYMSRFYIEIEES